MLPVLFTECSVLARMTRVCVLLAKERNTSVLVALGLTRPFRGWSTQFTYLASGRWPVREPLCPFTYGGRSPAYVTLHPTHSYPGVTEI